MAMMSSQSYFKSNSQTDHLQIFLDSLPQLTVQFLLSMDRVSSLHQVEHESLLDALHLFPKQLLILAFQSLFILWVQLFLVAVVDGLL